MRGRGSAGARCTLFDVNAMLPSTPWRAAARIGPLSRGGGSPPSLRAGQVSLPVVNLNVVVALALRVLPFGGEGVALAVLGNYAVGCLHHLAVLLVDAPRRSRAGALERDGLGHL